MINTGKIKWIFLSVAMKQASFDMMCDVQDFTKNEITVIPMTDDDKSKNRPHRTIVFFHRFMYDKKISSALLEKSLESFKKKRSSHS